MVLRRPASRHGGGPSGEVVQQILTGASRQEDTKATDQQHAEQQNADQNPEPDTALGRLFRWQG